MDDLHSTSLRRLDEKGVENCSLRIKIDELRHQARESQSRLESLRPGPRIKRTTRKVIGHPWGRDLFPLRAFNCKRRRSPSHLSAMLRVFFTTPHEINMVTNSTIVLEATNTQDRNPIAASNVNNNI
ncbi:hypothetical protein GUJ93_ZPchr0006g43670 [Zizania palustris]|uniref:Uncharacterized protein n=1 Tax=Zizania palustris TaxID=103762 RepID=A0A8J5SCY4_ZIZPA|nr:hypothetical protein GUJ93_ZPchr0006g43670 [Zizania palustris]